MKYGRKIKKGLEVHFVVFASIKRNFEHFRIESLFMIVISPDLSHNMIHFDENAIHLVHPIFFGI